MRAAFDTGLNFGWAIGLPGRKPLSGTKVFPSPGTAFHGRLLSAQYDWLQRLIEDHGIDEVAFEKPIHTKFDGLAKLRIIYPMIAIVEMVCHDMKIDCSEIDMTDARMAILGLARAPKHLKGPKAREWIKARVVGYCIARGWEPATDHEADAQLYLEYMHICGSSAYAAKTAGPLLTRGAA
jgi:hypothetical protein